MRRASKKKPPELLDLLRDKKEHADRCWERFFLSLSTDTPSQRICEMMDYVNTAEQIYLEASHQNKMKEILKPIK